MSIVRSETDGVHAAIASAVRGGISIAGAVDRLVLEDRVDRDHDRIALGIGRAVGGAAAVVSEPIAGQVQLSRLSKIPPGSIHVPSTVTGSNR
jgi:hypothetical protein